jgi:prevent-host-death family protein
MLEEIGSYDAKTKLPEILRRVEAGESFTITNRGKPIADVVPSRATRRLKCKAAISNIKKAKKYEVSDSELKDMMESGRK